MTEWRYTVSYSGTVEADGENHAINVALEEVYASVHGDKVATDPIGGSQRGGRMSATELTRLLTERAERVEHHVWQNETSEALGQLGAALETMQELAAELVELGIRAGLTQKRVADLLGVPASTLRGARREFSNG